MAERKISSPYFRAARRDTAKVIEQANTALLPFPIVLALAIVSLIACVMALLR